MLYDARGNPIPLTDSKVDLRTKQQRDFDRQFRAAMGNGGGPGFPPELIEKVKNQMVRRDTAKALGLDPGTLDRIDKKAKETAYLDELAEAVKHSADHHKKGGHSLVVDGLRADSNSDSESKA
jgi:hypothetical protein